MATERLVSPQQQQRDVAEQPNWSLRPTRLDEYVGQPDLIGRLKITIRAVRERKEPMEHILLHGPPGLGKTTLAHVIGAEMGARVYVTSGPALSRPTDLVSALTRLEHGDILFIDEIHRLPVAVAGLLSAPMRSRFGISHHLRYYSDEELLTILRRSAKLLGLNVRGEEPLATIAARSRGTPRIANRLLRRVRDYAQVKGDGTIVAAIVGEALVLEGVDGLGLDELDRSYLKTISKVFSGGPVGVEACAATMNEDAGTLEDVVEPYLLQTGLLARTRRGRMLTRSAAEHLGLPVPTAIDGDSGLFE
jgi:holliday junction DNA helicase RuvB